MNIIQTTKVFNQIQEVSLATQELIDKFSSYVNHVFTFYKTDAFVPNETALMPDYRSYFDLIDSAPITPKTIAKWQLLEQLATQKKGQLLIFVQNNNLQKIKTILQENQIKASVQSI